MRLRQTLFAIGTLVTSTCFAEIKYVVTANLLDNSMTVAMTIPVAGNDTTVQMPNWAPGSYRLQDFAAATKGHKAVGGNGSELKLEHPNPYTWTIASSGQKVLTFSYALPMQPNNGTVHFSGPSTYMYVVDRKTERCTLTLGLPEGWRAETGLEPKKGGSNSFVADDYDVLADNPVTMGRYLADFYVSHGVPHTIVYHSGPTDNIDRAAVIKACQFISDAQGDFWGGLPFKRYVWHFTPMQARDGGWGLEHLSSTQIGLAVGLGRGTVSVMSHEYFHAWNVKRIRSSVLGPFDYTQLPKTGALWWLEGVTDYYANVFLHRYGMFGEDYWFNSILSNVQRTRANNNRFQVSPYDSSYRVGEASNGRGNSQGFGVNYYNTGWLVGCCLDIELRSRTGGKSGLDTVSKSLWDLCKTGRPGFLEGEIRQQLIKVGGSGMGEVYDTWVMKPGELPVESQLAKVGLMLSEAEESFIEMGFDASVARGEPVLRVIRVRPALEGKLKVGDAVVSFNGKPMQAATWRELNSLWSSVGESMKAGETVRLVIKRGEEESAVDIKAESATRKIPAIREVQGATPAQLKLRSQWYAKVR